MTAFEDYEAEQTRMREAERAIITKFVKRLSYALAREEWPAEEVFDCYDYAVIASTAELRALCKTALKDADAFRRRIHKLAGTSPARRIVDEKKSLARSVIRARDPIIKKAENGFFYIHWTGGRRSKRLSTRKRTLAEAQVLLEKRCPNIPPAPLKLSGDPVCAELWVLYMREHVERSCADDQRHVFAWKALAPTFAKLHPRDVTQAVIDRHVAARAPVKPSSVRTELVLLQASWAFGVKRRAIASTDVPAVTDLVLPDAPPPRERWLRDDEARRLFAAAAETREGGRLSRVERFVWLALETAGRRNALLELRWGQVDFETRVVHLNPEGRRQTSKRRASVPISDALLSVLRRAWDERKTDFVLDHPSRLHEHLDALGRRAGVEGVTPHVFRHTAATWMARRGVSLWKIAKILGNSVEQVERVYAKHSPDDLRESVNLISGPRPL